LNNGGFALTVLADKCHALRRMQMKIQVIDDSTLIPRILEADVTKFKSLPDRAGSRQRVRFGLNCGLHIEERQQVGQEQSLVRDSGEGREHLLNSAAGLHDRRDQEVKGADT